MRTIRILQSMLLAMIFLVPDLNARKYKMLSSSREYCEALRDNSGDGWSVYVDAPGSYCIAEDLHQSWPLVRLPHQAVPKSPLLYFNGSKIIINLMGRNISAKTPIGQGIWVNAPTKNPHHDIKIINGTIITSSQPTVVMIHDENGRNKRFGEAYSIADYNGDISHYRPTVFILENLTLEADGHVIIMQGMKNIIRNCKIIGGNGTVNLYGPNLLFENNEIILHAKEAKEEMDEPPVALYLEDAAGSVVRNNHIVINGRASNPDAIVLKNSPNVELEGNVIAGARQVYRLLDDRSSVKATKNMIVPAATGIFKR